MSAKTAVVKEADTKSHAGRTGSAHPSTKTGERGEHFSSQHKRTTGRINIQVAAAQQLFSSDPKYKKYTQQVEKCLNAFDNVHEWADCIAFLKQLLKVRHAG
jgi:hypothetical protein